MKFKPFFITFLFAITLLLANTSEAAFSISGTTITQSGTDTDISGLAGVTGVTTITTGTGNNEYTVYNVGDRKLIIDGELILNVQEEKIVFGTNAPFQSFTVNGEFTIEGRNTQNGVTRYYNKEFATITRFTSTRSNANSAGLVVNNGGILNWYGGSLRTSQSSFFQPGSTILLDKAEFNIQHATTTDYQVRSFSTDLTINNLTTNGTFLLYRDPGQPIKNVTGIQNPFALMSYGPPTGTTDLISYEDYQGFGNDADISFIDGSNTDFINAADGSETKVGLFKGFQTGGGSRHRGLVKIYKDATFKFSDLLSQPIEDVHYYVRDTDNGNRVNNGSSDDSSDNIYTDSSDAVGETSDQRILLSVINKTDSVYEHPLSDTYYDYRDEAGDGSDIFTTYFWGYNEQSTNIPLEYKGVGIKEFDITLLPDTNISESNKIIVDVYTSIDTLDQLYDRAKSWKIDNVGLEYPAIGEQLMIGNGASLDFGNRNLVVDDTTPQAFDVDTATDTITINSSLLGEGDIFTSFITTGIVTYQNGAVQDTDYTDNTGFYPVDNTDPSISIISQVPTKIDNQGITIDIQATDDREITLGDVQVSLANTTAGVANFICAQTSTTQVDCTLQVLSSGNVEIRAEDARGLSATELDLNYIIDTEAPDITAALNTTAPFTTNSPEVTFSATDNISASGDINFTISVDDGPFVAQSSPYTPTLVGDRHIIVVRAADELGNESEFSFVYTPLLTITAPTTTSNANIADTTITASSINDLTDVTITGAGSTFVCTPNPMPASPSSGPVTCTGVITTTGTLDISATDTLITDSADIGYTIERTPPVIVITAPTTSGTDGITDTTITVTDDVAVNANDVFIDGSSSSAARLFNCTQTSTTQVDCTIDIASSGSLVILARDRSDNEATATQSYTVIPSGFSPTSDNGGGGGSNSLMLCTSDSTAANYYGGDLDLDAFRFYKIVKRCIYGDKPQEIAITEIIEEAGQKPIEISYEKPQCTINYSRLIKRGLRGNDVKQVQRCMNSLGYTSGPEDGIYGSLTYRGITAYQRAQRLQYIDGIVGPETSGSLNDLGDVAVTGI